MGVDDAECLAEWRRGRWMIDGEQWSQQTAVDLGVEDGDANSVVVST